MKLNNEKMKEMMNLILNMDRTFKTVVLNINKKKKKVILEEETK